MRGHNKICIWCKEDSKNIKFEKLAHTIPQALGGKNICTNVCDKCNEFFGNYYQGSPSIETIIKETFNISRARFLAIHNKVGKNKPMSKFSSIYFKVDFGKHKISLKPSYSLKKGFQELIGRQLKRGLYKILLEEIERQQGDSLDPKYDFIREYARYNIGDYPVFYFKRKHGIILMVDDWVISPELHLVPNQTFHYLVDEPSFIEFEFLGHVFGLATSRHWHLVIDNYVQKTMKAKKEIFNNCIAVKNFNDIDLTLSILDE